MMGRSGFTTPPPLANIIFEPPANPVTGGPPANSVAASAFGLLYADASSTSSLPLASSVTGTYNASGTQPNWTEMGGVGLDIATVSQYAQSGGNATSWGTRYRVYAEPGSGTPPPGVLYAVDLLKSGSPPLAPAAVQLGGSGATIASMTLCSHPAVVFDNYSAAAQSWLLFHALGPDNNCGTLDDQYVVVQLTSTTAFKPLAQVEPVEALHDNTGALTGYLAISHPTVCTTTSCTCPSNPSYVSSNGQPVCPPPLQQLDTGFAATTTFSATLLGSGNNVAGPNGADFLSLGVSSANIWLYWDSTQIAAVNLATGATTQLVPSPSIPSLGTGDSVTSRAVFDGTTAYVGISNPHTHASDPFSRILQINLSTLAVTATVTDAAATAGITLVGVTSNDLIYVVNDGSGIKSIPKTSPTAPTALKSLSGTQKIDSLMGISASTAPAAFLVGDTVYFTVADSSASGTTGFAKQAFYFTTTGTATSATAIANSVSAVLGVVAPASIPTTGPYANAGALVLTGGINTATAGVPAFADGPSNTQATLNLYSSNPTAAPVVLGKISSKATGGTAGPLLYPITGVALNDGPAQMGMPAVLQLIGKDGSGVTAGVDLAVFTTDGTTIPLTEISGFDN
jgi:hypothetical protein